MCKSILIFVTFPFSLMMIFLVGFGRLLRVSSCSWVGIWRGLELNMLCFLPILIQIGGFQRVESGVKYFLVQAFGSVFLLFSGVILDRAMSSFFSMFFFYFLIFSLILKLGVFPFHWWVPGVIGGMGWLSLAILLTWQKFAPVLLIFNCMGACLLVVRMGCFSSLIGGLGGIGQGNSRLLLSYSSIGHLGWIIAIGGLSYFVGVLYFIVYFVGRVFVLALLWWVDLSRVTQGIFGSSGFFFFFFICLFSLGGVPPLFGFLRKMLGLYWLAFEGGFILFSFFLIVGSLIRLYFYLSLFFSVFFFFFSYSFAYYDRFKRYFFLLFLISSLFVFSFFFFDFLFLLV